MIVVLATDVSAATAAGADALRPPPPNCDGFYVFFDPERADLSPEAAIVISQAVLVTRERRAQVHVEGHVDGQEAHTPGLSLQRAAAVKQEMVRQGIGPDEIDTSGSGFSSPLMPTALGVAEPLNRRAYIYSECPK
jgi:OOP family OmpA-OmpF porin